MIFQEFEVPTLDCSVTYLQVHVSGRLCGIGVRGMLGVNDQLNLVGRINCRWITLVAMAMRDSPPSGTGETSNTKGAAANSAIPYFFTWPYTAHLWPPRYTYFAVPN